MSETINPPLAFAMDDMVAQLRGEEAEKYFVYDDANGAAIRSGTHVVGNPTAGIGRNLATKGLTDAEARYLCANDVIDVAGWLDQDYPWWRKLSPLRQMQMVDLEFNMGRGGLRGFPHFLAAMQAGHWPDAVAELQNSAWWDEVGERGPMITDKILAG